MKKITILKLLFVCIFFFCQSFASSKEILKDEFCSYNIEDSVLFLQGTPTELLYTLKVKPLDANKYYLIGISQYLTSGSITFYKIDAIRLDGSYIHIDYEQEKIKNTIKQYQYLLLEKITNNFTKCEKTGVRELYCYPNQP